jgi:hypothetical protein
MFQLAYSGAEAQRFRFQTYKQQAVVVCLTAFTPRNRVILYCNEKRI